MISDKRLLGAALLATLSLHGLGCYQITCEEEGMCGGTPDLTESDGGRTEGGVGEGSFTDSGSGDALFAEGSGEGGACDGMKSPAEQPCLVADAYGVFVSPGGNDTTGTGTRTAPYKTFAKALPQAKSHGGRVFACDDGTGYAEQLTIDSTLDGLRMYGGFTCGTWAYTTTTRAVVKPAATTALKISGLTTGLAIEDFKFDSADATTAGASSIAVIADTVQNVAFKNVKVVAGKGAGGAAGADGTRGADGPGVDPQQQGGLNASCSATSRPGGSWGAKSSCNSIGGPGGDAKFETDGTPGGPGDPRTNVNPPGTDNGGSKGATGGDGAAGSPGSPGMPGAAAPANASFSAAGYTPAGAGGNGASDGFPGQGGGGGGASNALFGSGCFGASGGAGGMGGCGGKLGTGGASGGPSIALFSWNSGVTLTSCELVASNGGAGGKGGNGGAGGLGKDGAQGGQGITTPSTVDAAGKGGMGGDGGMGGPGAGGNGGPSYALVYKGTEPTQTATTLTPGVAGIKGAGGTAGTVKAPDGAAGDLQQKYAVQ